MSAVNIGQFDGDGPSGGLCGQLSVAWSPIEGALLSANQLTGSYLAWREDLGKDPEVTVDDVSASRHTASPVTAAL